jgi:PhnB protein
MTSTVKPVLDGTHTIVAYICVKGAAAAIDFYRKAFGATEIMARIADGTGRIGHAEIRIGDSVVMMADEHPEHGFLSPQTLGGCPVLFMVNIPDVDAMVARAVAAGGRLTRPVENQFYGSRTGEIIDPFGYRWYLSTHVENVSEEEIVRRAAEGEKSRAG